ncbi:rpp14 family protein [Cyclospora cayetanensis]|uniref:Ribonuclease P/MRP protein subunit POP5 n=1 Tax=Cyclospora cayetanensis TaxID=88456 RepID=A0A1D3CYF3_9EIME|nr:rpp14 family protein [Cyclospora cayetanensis]
MVRSKSRWIVGEAEWTSAKRKGEPWNLQAFTEALQETVSGCWGAVGVACLLPHLRVVHLNRESGTFILQVARSYLRELLLVLMALTSVEGRGCRLHVLHIGGTLLKARRSAEQMMQLALARQLKELTEVLESFD